MATIVAAGGGGNWDSTATWVGGVVPGSGDDVQLSGGSGSVTINVAAACRSLDCTGYAATLTHASGVTLSIGDATAGLSNIALKLAATMTAYTLGSATTSALNFVSTSATQQTITWASKTPGNVTFNGTGGSWAVQDAWSASSTTVTLTTGTLNTNGQTCTWSIFSSNNANTRTLTLGASNITCAGTGSIIVWDINNLTGLTVTANTATVTMTGSGAIFQTAGINYNGMSIVFTGSGNAVVGAGSATFLNVTRTGTALKTDGFQLNGNSNTLTVTGTLSLNGNSTTNRLLIKSGSTGTQVTINAATVSISNADFQDIVATGAGNWNLAAITGNSGDCGNNSGVTFTTPATQTWQGASSASWSDVTKWTSRVPLPQDDVVINAAFSASQTVTADMPRLGHTISWTGVSGSPTWALNTTTNSIFGSLVLTAGVVLSGTQGITFAGRGSYTITSAGLTFANVISVTGTSYTLQDALTNTSTVAANFGTLITNDQTVTCSTLSTSQSSTVLNLGNSIINLTSTASGNLFIRGSGTITASAPTFNVVNASANSRTIAPQGLALANATINYTVSGSTGSLALSINSSFNIAFGTINFSDSSNARTLILPATNTTTVNTFNVQGTAGKLMSITSSTPGTTATLSKSSGFVNCDYLSIQDSTATGGASWYAGSNSTNVSNNAGWFFQAYSPSKFLEIM